MPKRFGECLTRQTVLKKSARERPRHQYTLPLRIILGQFEDPSDHGVICDCSYHGRYTCRRKECPPANCGTALQTTSGSCVQCAPQCATTRCPDLKCPVNERFYP
ncbi:hypothetical protein DPMN_058369 [Dreissena polymorpha]|uniref:Uncharacterized protein n=1 Tax=Dreissena polymorpha TaxID=45954 RepID=A0A9D4C1Z4_DREPO|nr:hypothetical protein DPMN_058369 [Dreissena polymorpha]